MTPAIIFNHVTKSYVKGNIPAVNDISMEIPAGSLVILLGPSGCGKTTLLKMVNRLHEPSSGQIILNGVDILEMPVTTLRRQIGYVIQQVGLFPHMTVAQNIAVVPELVKWPREKINAQIDELLELVHLPIDFRNRYPVQLSGGQQQRVGLARALAADPQVMLMDEPFGAIDAITRTSLQDEMLELQRNLHKTILFVTHDVDEALKLADQIVIINQGSLVQFDSPCALLDDPANDFVRKLLNTEDRIRQLSLLRVESIMSALPPGFAPGRQPTISSGSDLRQALSAMLQPGTSAITVMDGGVPQGQVTLKALQQVGCRDSAS